MAPRLRPAAIAAALLVVSAGCIQGGEPLEPSDAGDVFPDANADNATGPASTDESGTSPDGDATNATADEVDANQPPPDPREWNPLDNVTITDDERVALDAPVHVALVGFPASTAAALEERLEPVEVDHRTYSYRALVRTDHTPPTVLPSTTTKPNPLLPVANYTVHHLPNLGEQIDRRIGDWLVPDPDEDDLRVLDANAIEAFLAERLPAEGVPVERAPTLVLLHDGTPGDHAYRYRLPDGYLEPVRAFGGHENLLALDVSAAEDPWVTPREDVCRDGSDVEIDCRRNDRPINRPQTADGEATADALANATRAATHFRLLQGPLYEAASAPCYAATLIVGVEQTALTELAPTTPTAADLVDEERLARALDDVTGPMPTHVDVRLVHLPQDDPALDAVSESEDIRPVRLWLVENWEDYWVEHAGCEPIVSFHLFGDANERSDWGIALYDAERGYRLSFSVTEGRERLQRTHDGPGSEVFGDEDASRPGYDLANQLLVHETGHLIGLRHPHDVSPNDDTPTDTLVRTFSSTYTAMSYQTSERVTAFGELDRANLLRNRAGELAQRALVDELDELPGFEEALAAIGDRDWEQANEQLGRLQSGR